MVNKNNSNKKTKKVHINALDKEKAIIVYISLVRRYKEHRENITCSVFLNAWKDIFKCDKYNVSKENYQSLHNKQISAFAFVKGNFDNKSVEEIIEYRKTIMTYPSREVSIELNQLAQSKGVIVTLAENINNHLSGFNVVIKEGKALYQINEVPYGLSESDTKKFLEILPKKEDLMSKESRIINILKTHPANKSLVGCVNKYKEPYATKKFRDFMSHYTIYDCNNKELTNACVLLCKRVGINNPTNGRPIEYRFCVGSGKREQSMKCAYKRRRGNDKANEIRKGKK